MRHKEAVLNTPTMAPHQSPGKHPLLTRGQVEGGHGPTEAGLHSVLLKQKSLTYLFPNYTLFYDRPCKSSEYLSCNYN